MRSIFLTLALTVTVVSGHVQGQNPPVVAHEGTLVHRDLAYVANGHERQALDLYLPASTPRPLPLIVVIYGGAWRSGDKAADPVLAWGVPVLIRTRSRV